VTGWFGRTAFACRTDHTDRIGQAGRTGHAPAGPYPGGSFWRAHNPVALVDQDSDSGDGPKVGG
jgi:hypothetical protein